MPFRHPPCHSAIRHVIPPSVTGLISPFHRGGKLNIMLLISLPTSFRHPPPHSTIRHLIPPSATPLRHPPPHSSHRPSGPIFILSRWQAQHNTFDQPPHLILPSVTHSAIRHKSSVPISPLCQDSKLDIPLLISLPSHSTIRHVIPPSVTSLWDQFLHTIRYQGNQALHTHFDKNHNPDRIRGLTDPKFIIGVAKHTGLAM